MNREARLDRQPAEVFSMAKATRARSAHAAGLAYATPEVLGEVDSTNRYLVDLVRDDLEDGRQVPDGYAVVADHQRAGRGRLGRRWVAPPKSALLCSVLMRPRLPAERLALATWAVGLAGAAACEELSGHRPGLKWPNDLLIADKKVGGILAEVVPGAARAGHGSREADDGGRETSIVVGIGINVSWPSGPEPSGPEPSGPDPSADGELAEIYARATCLDAACGARVDRSLLAGSFLAHLRARRHELDTDAGRDALVASYRRSCATLGRTVRVDLGDRSFTGTAVDLDELGRLLVDTADGLQAVSAGDVVHLR